MSPRVLLIGDKLLGFTSEHSNIKYRECSNKCKQRCLIICQLSVIEECADDVCVAVLLEMATFYDFCLTKETTALEAEITYTLQ